MHGIVHKGGLQLTQGSYVQHPCYLTWEHEIAKKGTRKHLLQTQNHESEQAFNQYSQQTVTASLLFHMNSSCISALNVEASTCQINFHNFILSVVICIADLLILCTKKDAINIVAYVAQLLSHQSPRTRTL